MIKFLKYYQFYSLWFLLFVVYYMFLYKYKLIINYPIMYSAYMAVLISTIIDIIKKEGGSPNFYRFSKEINQKIRYGIFLITTIFAIVGHQFLLCDKLKIFMG